MGIFLATGVTPKARADRLRHRTRLGVATALSAVAAIAYPLARESADLVARQRERSTLDDQVRRWLGQRHVQIQDIEVGEADRFRVVVNLAGTDPLPAPQSLASVLAHKLNHPVVLIVRYTPRSEQVASGVPVMAP